MIEQAPDPHPGPGEIRVRATAAGVNPIDWKLRTGALRQLIPLALPAVPGRDAVGVVDEIGAGVQGVSIGDRVFSLGGVTGATAELAVLSAWAHACGTRCHRDRDGRRTQPRVPHLSRRPREVGGSRAEPLAGAWAVPGGRQTRVRAYVPVPSCLPPEYWRMNSPSAYRSWPIMEPVYLFCTPIFELPGTSR